MPPDPHSPSFWKVRFSGSSRISLDSQSLIWVTSLDQASKTFSLSTARERVIVDIASSLCGSSTAETRTGPRRSWLWSPGCFSLASSFPISRVYI
jgi:hypothetical protein